MKTTIILGAGASVHYGFPTGAQLIKDVINFLNDPNNCRNIRSDLKGPIEDFCLILQEADPTSIDSFLTLHAKNENFVELGKKIISSLIISKQDPSKFSALFNEENWYKYLYNYLCRDNYSILDNDDLRIITFNYDLSLEYYFDRKLEQDPNLLPERKADLLKKFTNKIHHVYGAVYSYLNPFVTKKTGASPSEERFSALNFFCKSNGDCLINFLQKKNVLIRVIGEDRNFNKDKRHKDFIQYLEKSNRVFVLGFGFDSENVNILGLCNQGPSDIVRQLYYTNMGVSPKITGIVEGLPFNRSYFCPESVYVAFTKYFQF